MTTDNLPVLTPKTPGFSPDETGDLPQAWTRLGSDLDHTWTKGSIWLLNLLAEQNKHPNNMRAEGPQHILMFWQPRYLQLSHGLSTVLQGYAYPDHHGQSQNHCQATPVGGCRRWRKVLLSFSRLPHICHMRSVRNCSHLWREMAAKGWPLRPGAPRQMLVDTDPTCVLGLGAALVEHEG